MTGVTGKFDKGCGFYLERSVKRSGHTGHTGSQGVLYTNITIQFHVFFCDQPVTGVTCSMDTYIDLDLLGPPRERSGAIPGDL